jgi:hypothetical protein
MRKCLPLIWFGLLSLCFGYSEPLTLDQLKAMVQTGDSTAITNWLSEQYPVIFDDATSEDPAAAARLKAHAVFLYAVQSGKREVVMEMMGAGIDPNKVLTAGDESPLYIATVADDQPMKDTLVYGGADPLYRLNENDAPLAHMLWLSFANHDTRFPDLCLQSGLDPNYTFVILGNDSLVNASIRTSNLEAFRYLLGKGADISIVRASNNYKTTLALAIQDHGERSDFVEVLRKLGAFDMKYTKAIPDQAVSATDRLRIRNIPNQSGSTLGYLNKGDIVGILEVTPLSYRIDGIDSPWIRVTTGRTKGWVFGGYLSALRPQ